MSESAFTTSIRPPGRTTRTSLELNAPTYPNPTVQLQGWAAGEASTLRLGQYFQIGEQLVVVTEAAIAADAGGKVTVSFAPQLRRNYASGTALNFTTPSGVFRLNAGSDLGFTIDPDRVPEFSSMTAREVI